MNSKQIRKAVSIFTVICIIITMINVAYDFLLPMYLSYKLHVDLGDASSIGIIGGADGPTTIYLSGFHSYYLFTALFAILSIIGIVYLIFTNRKKDNKDLNG